MSQAVLYPYKESASRWRGWELLHSLRSLEQNFPGTPVRVLSAAKPAFSSDALEWAECATYEDCLEHLASCTEDRVLWMNDDIFLLQPSTWDDFEAPVRALGPFKRLPETRNPWPALVNRTVDRLVAEFGVKDPANFSVHCPYLFRPDKVREALGKIPPVRKLPLETVYYNLLGVPWRKDDDVHRCYSRKGLPADMSPFRVLNVSDSGLWDFTKGWIRGRFPVKSKFET